MKWFALVFGAVVVACGADGDSAVAEDDATFGVVDGEVDSDTIDALGGAEGALTTLVAPVPTKPIHHQKLVLGTEKRLLELPLGLEPAGAEHSASDTLDPALAELGNLLFFDERLSAGAQMSCASCHQAKAGFAAKGINRGVHGEVMQRTTPPAFNRLFGLKNNWLGQRSLEDQSLAPITSHSELDFSEAQLLAFVRGNLGYRERLEHLVDAGRIHAPAVSVVNIQRALATFQRTLLAGNSRVDQFEAGVANALTPEEKAGRLLFHNEAHCTRCHSGPNYTDEDFHVIQSGCPSNEGQCSPPTPTFEAGRYFITGSLSDLGKFKTPSLRNVGVRGPYFHNGHDATLQEVVDGYNEHSDLQKIIGQDAQLENLKLNPTQVTRIILFLRALTGPIEISAAMSTPGTATSAPDRERYLLSPAVFDLATYRSHNPDLAKLTDDQLRAHWIAKGSREGRFATARFNAKEYDALTAKNGNYLAAVEEYLDHGRRLRPLDGRFATSPAFFDVDEYRDLNFARLGLSTMSEVVKDFLGTAPRSKLPGRRRYDEGTRFRLAGTTGKDYQIVGGKYCEIAKPTAAALPVWPYAPVPSAGPCR